MMNLRQLMVTATLWLLLNCGPVALSQTGPAVDSPTVAKKVTVTLVRWPYT